MGRQAGLGHRAAPAVGLPERDRPRGVLQQQSALGRLLAWSPSESARYRRNDSVRSHRSEPAGVRTRSSQPTIRAARPAPATAAPDPTTAGHGAPGLTDRTPPTTRTT